VRSENYFDERVSRLLILAEAAQEASARTPDPDLMATYARIADHWLKLASMAVGIGGLSRHLPVAHNGHDSQPDNRAN